MGVAGTLHDKFVVHRRVHILAAWFAQLIPQQARVLDVGCGDGSLSATLLAKRPDLMVRGVDVLLRDRTHIPVELFDGFKLPFDDGSFDAVLFSDVLHHTKDPLVLMREARRVTTRRVIVKDHFREGAGAQLRLRFMDWVGNARFGVSLPYNYWTESQWAVAWQGVGLRPVEVVTSLRLYPLLADWIFGARLHFVALLEK
jgi:SAM-dependent methyltransferase